MSLDLDYAGIRHLVIDRFGAGAVTVLPGSDDVVRGTLDSTDDTLLSETEIRPVHDQLRIVLPRSWGRTAEAFLELHVPDGLEYTVTTGSADVRIEPSAARVRLTTGSGDLGVGQVDELTCTSGSGDIVVGHLRGREARLTTGSGDIVVEQADFQVQAKSASGDIRVDTLSGGLTANTASGDITVPSTTGSVDLRSASGDLTVGVADGLPVWLDLSAVSGSIDIGLDADAGPEAGDAYLTVRARTASGDITVHRA
ncbi:hypothetical protein FHX74_001021 [Friedmanniella endophytica]|uniref:DUF4097 domain-containing protein n=1 Tax=Microlunatus kandeliicorticis TaxID=1759536 RepID=A0A7W3IQK0_9ACTN|nr:DUF4097 family beta strand repeat-containing protein [Microlunatus kandeliicorticis]MBA8793416.1 hypothetical protein [Microlunatus kandeliicorticis]